MFDDLPGTSVLVHAVVLGVSLAGPASAAEPPEGLPHWATSGVQLSAGTIVSAWAVGATEDEARRNARVAAVGVLADHVRRQTGTADARTATAEQILAGHPDWGTLQPKEVWIRLGDEVQVAVRYAIPDAAWRAFQARYLASVAVGPHRLVEDFVGGLLIADTGVPVVRVQGVRVDTLADLPPLGSEVLLTLHDASGRELDEVVWQLEPEPD